MNEIHKLEKTLHSLTVRHEEVVRKLHDAEVRYARLAEASCAGMGHASVINQLQEDVRLRDSLIEKYANVWKEHRSMCKMHCCHFRESAISMEG